MTPTRLAVLGSPIGHSLSPTLHRAAYDTLELDWTYEAIEVSGPGLENFVAGCDSSWRGLSLTMPLKRDILGLLTNRSPLVVETGSANTVLFGERGAEDRSLHGFNTDVFGITEAFARHDRDALGTVLILGAGATAASALVAVNRLGARTVFVGVRSPERAGDLVAVGRALGLEPLIRRLDGLLELDEPLDAVVSTLPNGAGVDIDLDADIVRDAALFDVAYSPWPTPLAAAWTGPDIIGGLEMLVLQALQQVRLFVGGDPRTALDREGEVLAAMLASVGL